MSVQLVIAAWLIDLATVWIAKHGWAARFRATFFFHYAELLMCGAYALRVGGASVIVPDAWLQTLHRQKH